MGAGSRVTFLNVPTGRVLKPDRVNAFRSSREHRYATTSARLTFTPNGPFTATFPNIPRPHPSVRPACPLAPSPPPPRPQPCRIPILFLPPLPLPPSPRPF